MRVGLISAPYFPIPPQKYGGTERVVYYLIKGLLEAGVEVVLFGPGDSEVDCEVIPTIKKSRRYVDDPNQLEEQNEWVGKVKQKLRHLLIDNDDRLDLIHNHWNEFHYDGATLPYMQTLHGPVTFGNIAYYQQYRDLNYNSISHTQAEGYKFLNVVGNAYNGLDANEFPIVTEPEDYVCWLGRFDSDKLPDQAIKAAIAIGIKIKVAGKIDFFGKNYFEREVKHLLNHPLVEYLGEIGGQDKVELLSKAKANFHPLGFSEPFGLTVLEAGYCGTPTISMNRGSMPELIEHGKSGLIVNDFAEVYAKFDNVLSLNREVVANSFRNRFSYQRMATEYIEIYKKVLANHSKPRDIDTSMGTVKSIQ